MNINSPIAIVTAKQHSTRLPFKNMLPLGGIPLTVWSINEAKRQQMETIVSTDIPELKVIAEKMGCTVVHQPSKNEKWQDITHREVMLDAIKQTKTFNRPAFLLQPTSPFRFQNIMFKCWKKYLENPTASILSATKVHSAVIENNKVNNEGRKKLFWDGCVAVFPPDKICEFDYSIAVQNYYINSLQIDNEEDYIMACSILETSKEIAPIFPSHMLILFREIFKQNNIGNYVTLVGRPNGKPIPQNDPVFYINHCRGYEGGRCDGLFVIANEHIKLVGINQELRECAKKAKFVIVRHNGELDWLVSNLPEMQGKYYPIRDLISPQDDHLTTGCIAANLLTEMGIKVDFVGLHRPRNLFETIGNFHHPALSREIALLNKANVLN